MKIQIEKADAASLTALEKQIRELEFKLVSLGKERDELLNRYFEQNQLLPMEGNFQISSLPDWSEVLIVKK